MATQTQSQKLNTIGFDTKNSDFVAFIEVALELKAWLL